MGAVAVLAEEWRWYPYGDLTPAEAADAWNDIINQVFFDSVYGGGVCAAPVQTPFWDDDVDVDDEAPADDQRWYGYVTDAASPPSSLTFVEDAAIWTVTGFILLSLGGAGIAPALFFRAKAPAFVMQHRNDNAGDIIRYFIDGSLVSEWSDDGSGDIIDVPLSGDPDNETHDVYVTIEKAA